MSMSAPVGERLDSFPTQTVNGYGVRPGRVQPFGASLVPGGINFSVFSSSATSVTLVLFERGTPEPVAEIPFPDHFRVGHVYAMTVFGLDPETMEYGYRIDGPFDPSAGHRHDATKVLLDPYAKSVAGHETWGATPSWESPYPFRGRVPLEDFDWQGDSPLEIPMQDLVIYEAHARGFTAHASSGVSKPGTFAGLREKIPYLKSLGVNAIELMPIFDFDEWENTRPDPITGEPLMNYWGYSTLAFFAPKAGFAATGSLGMEVDELKTLIRALHKEGIEVILDVVFNHTAEGNEMGPTLSFKGLDNKTFYMLTPEGYYFNFSGTGNTLNCNNPVVRHVVLDCLRYWASEFHIDGFRFDLAAVLGRAPNGAPLANPPLLEALAHDPILGRCKLIAEAWDAGGLYQVGSFPAYGRWAEWNGKFRDTARRFVKGDPGFTSDMSIRIAGSPDLYWHRGPTATVNFITAHDGFTLADLVAYDGKHNERNGEGNNDGANDNYSWNCGAEGPSADEDVLALRDRQVRNLLVALLTSHGVPMIVMGDECGRTQAGNNNTYCHDNELTWFDWSQVDENAGLVRFTSRLIEFRHAHGALRPAAHRAGAATGGPMPAISFHGTRAWEGDWSDDGRHIATLFAGDADAAGVQDLVFVILNAHWEAMDFDLPGLQDDRRWAIAANTAMPSPMDFADPGAEWLPDNPWKVLVGPRSAMILLAKHVSA